MDDNQEPYWKKHLTGIIQCVFGFYCCVIATLAYFFPRPIPTSQSAPSGGAAMSTTYYMPWYLWLGIVGLALSVMIPAMVKMVRGRRERPSKLSIHSANYAAVDGDGRSYDVTSCLQKMVAGDSALL